MSQFSSGDVIADRRADYARMLAEGRDFAAAGELMEQALELAPEWAAGWFRLGEYREKAELASAEQAYRRALELEPDDIFGATLRLAVIGATDAPDQPPSRYVESLFDDYADRFDTALVEKLDYSVPGKLANLVVPYGPFTRTVDLGCGTGLFGAEIRTFTGRLEGFDLSQNMLAKAQEKGLYDHLGQSDLSLAADQSGLFGTDLPHHRADLVSAADVLMYLGSLETVFPLVADLLAPGAIFAFSVEEVTQEEPEGQGYVLRDSLRYAHSEAHIRLLLAHHRLELVTLERTTIRMDAGKPVSGILFLSRSAG
jgi:predicted TPR repeat methyltransferase